MTMYGIFTLVGLLISSAAAAAVPAPGAVSPAQGDDSFEVTFVNKHTEDVVAWNANNYNTGTVPTLVTGREDSTIAVNGTSTYRMASGWAGGWQVNTAAYGISGKDSVVEGSWDASVGMYIDVSFVTGFSLPIVCGCGKKGMVIGCNRDLRAINHGCLPGTDNERGACVNTEPDVLRVADFYRPCDGGAYAHTEDHLTMMNNVGLCTREHQVCCIGTDCPDAWKQPRAARTGFYLAGSPRTADGASRGPPAAGVGDSSADITSPAFRPAGLQMLPGGSRADEDDDDAATAATAPQPAAPSEEATHC